MSDPLTSALPLGLEMSEPPGGGNKRGRETRLRILDAAAELLAVKGYEFTLEDVADAAETSRMTVYRHFGSRENLLTILLLQAAARLGDELRLVLGDGRPFPERLEDVIVRIVRAVEEAPYLQAVVTGNPGSNWVDLDPDRRFVNAVWAFFTPYVEAASKECRFRAEVEPTVDWILRQVLLLLTVDSEQVQGLDGVRRQVRTFLVPSILVES